MKISIITPSFNQAQYIEQTIDSVLSQNYPNLEYIIIDGGSDDGSVNIIKKYQKFLSYWISEADEGQSDAINKGISKASGDIINWLNSDDYYEPDALKTVSYHFEDPSTTALCAKANHVCNNGFKKVSRGTDVYTNNLAKTMGWARIDQPETFFSRSAWEKVGLLNTNLHYLMDREWWIRYLFVFGLDGITISDDILVNFRLHDTSKTVSKSGKFQEDHDALFYGLAKQYGFHKIAACIKDNCIINSTYILPKNISIEQKLVESCLNYYLLHRAHEFYYQENKSLSKTFLKLINKKQLENTDQKLYNRLFFRNTFAPQSIINTLRDKSHNPNT